MSPQPFEPGRRRDAAFGVDQAVLDQLLDVGEQLPAERLPASLWALHRTIDAARAPATAGELAREPEAVAMFLTVRRQPPAGGHRRSKQLRRVRRAFLGAVLVAGGLASAAAAGDRLPPVFDGLVDVLSPFGDRPERGSVPPAWVRNAVLVPAEQPPVPSPAAVNTRGDGASDQPLGPRPAPEAVPVGGPAAPVVERGEQGDPDPAADVAVPPADVPGGAVRSGAGEPARAPNAGTPVTSAPRGAAAPPDDVAGPGRPSHAVPPEDADLPEPAHPAPERPQAGPQGAPGPHGAPDPHGAPGPHVQPDVPPVAGGADPAPGVPPHAGSRSTPAPTAPALPAPSLDGPATPEPSRGAPPVPAAPARPERPPAAGDRPTGPPPVPPGASRHVPPADGSGASPRP